MGGDRLSCVEVFREQRRRHDERRAGVGESFAGGAVDRKLARRREGRQASQIADGVRVFGVAQPAENDAARIAGIGARFRIEISPHPLAQRFSLVGRGLLGVLGRHFPLIEHLRDLLPRRRALSARWPGPQTAPGQARLP